MPLLKPPPLVSFDPRNPEHVLAIAEIELLGSRRAGLHFDFQAPFVDGVSYAKHLMHLAWIEDMMETFPEHFKELKPRLKAEKALREAPVGKRPAIIGSKLPLERGF